MNIEDIEYELTLSELAGETETDPFTVMINEIDNWLINLLENLHRHNIELKRFSSDIEIREREKSYEIRSMNKTLFLAKRHNTDIVLKLLRQRLFSDILYKEIFIAGLAFTFRRISDSDSDDFVVCIRR